FEVGNALLTVEIILIVPAEMKQGAGHLSGALKYADAQLCRDDEDYLDREQGIPHLKGVACRVNKVTPEAVSMDVETIAELAK
ncbi:MAG: hypothetical protein AAFX02_10205, partial [Pseudomonadota bacterium]